MSFSSVAFSQTPFGASGDVSAFAVGVVGTTALGTVTAVASSAAQNLTGVSATLSIGTATTTVAIVFYRCSNYRFYRNTYINSKC